MTHRLPLSTDSLEALERLSGIRLVAIDVDGTLLDQPNAEVAEVIAGLNRSLGQYRRAVTLTIATGRSFGGARPVIERLQLSNRTPVILYNGAVVCAADGSSLTRLHSLHSEQIARIVELATNAGLSPLVYEPDFALPLWGDHEGPMVERVTGFAPEAGPPIEFNGLPVMWQTSAAVVPDTAAAIVIPSPRGIPDDLLARLAQFGGATVTRSSISYLEVRPEGANKGAALSVVASGRSLTSTQVLAIGDNDNDAEMLRWAGCSVAVANSTPIALAESDYVTEGAAGDGVVEALRLLFDARRHRLRR
jgi:Cof subfamily protein (haloacid dehalogenase superfamily)